MECTVQFDIIRYLSGLTGFVFDKDVLYTVAVNRGVTNVHLPEELDERMRDLLLADLLRVVYMSPNVIASQSNKHGSFEQSVGSQTINDKKGIYKMMIALYRKWGEEDKIELLPDASGTLSWLE